MSYSGLYIKKSQKALSILGVVAVLTIIIGAAFFLNQLQRKNGWQKVDGIRAITIANRSPQGFDVIWTTKNAVSENQWVEVGPQKGVVSLSSNAENNDGVYQASVTGLKPNTTYYFRIRLGSKTYTLPSLMTDSIHTPTVVKESPVSPAYGKVLHPQNTPFTNGVLIYEVEGFYPLAVYTKQTGEWLVPLTGLVEKKSNSIQPVPNTATVLLRLFTMSEGSIRTVVGQTRPLHQAIIADSSLHLAAESTHGPGETVLGVSTQNGISQTSLTSTITYPKENALIPGTTPLIKGTAPVGATVSVLIQGAAKQYSYRTTADEKGDWLIQSPLVLSPGKYTIVITVDGKGARSTIVQRTFSIIKDGEQVLGVATGSPTLAPTALPTASVPTSAPTSVPTTLPTPTTITSNGLFPTGVIPTRFVPTATPPVTGGGMSTYLFGALFCIVVGVGLVLAF